MKKIRKKILFIENKTGIFYWDKISIYLKKNFDIHWIVQNHIYTPKFGIKHIIDYPKIKDLKKLKKNNKFKKIRSADRGHNHFGQSTDHYHYYYKEIKNIISNINPSLIIGEATLFHELIAIKISKELNIRYIFPTGTRYPNGRTIFNKYDTQNFIKNKKKSGYVNKFRLNKIFNLILNNKHLPQHMESYSLVFKLKLLIFKFYAFYAYISGEKYNTPSPIKYTELYVRRIYSKFLWKIKSSKNKKNLDQLLMKKVVLYPLQIQPESNIDVWGYPHSNQVKIITDLSYKLKKIGYYVAVKTNPKFKYEINYKSLINLNNLSNLILIPPDVSMNYLIKYCDAIFSITGTIILESVIKGIKVFTLDKSDFSNHHGITKVKKIDEIIPKLKNFKKKKFNKNNKYGLRMLKKIYRFSFPYAFTLYWPGDSRENSYSLMAKSIIDIEKNEKF